jgi:cell division protein FtsI/penicillin-binding protein 2
MKVKNEISQYAPWDLENKEKKKPQRRGIPQSNQKFDLRSMPKSKDHSHLEMYVLAREKERLEKYGSTLGRRVKTIASTWKDVKSRMYDLHKNSTNVGKEGIEDFIKDKKEKKKEKKKIQGDVQKIDWEY